MNTRRIRDCYINRVSSFIPTGRDLATDARRRGELSLRDFEKLDSLSTSVAAPDMWPPHMAVRAGQKVLEGASAGPDGVSLLLHAYVNYQGQAYWDPSSFIQEKLELRNANSLCVQKFCNSGMLATDLALDHLLSREDSGAAMVTSADRFGAPQFGRWQTDYGITFGDGATAMLLSRTPGLFRFLSCETITEPFLERVHRGADAFGPLDTSRIAGIDVRRVKKAFMAEFGKDELMLRIRKSVESVTHRALEKAQASERHLRRVILPNVGRNLVEDFYLPVLGVTLEQTMFAFGREVGHLGAGDVAAGLAELERSQSLRSGDLVLGLGAGGGYSWTAVVLEKT